MRANVFVWRLGSRDATTMRHRVESCFGERLAAPAPAWGNGHVVDPDILSRRILALSEALGELERSGGADANKLRQDTTLRAAVERWLQVAVESCIHMAFHIVSENEWTPPDTAGGAFRTLASHGLSIRSWRSVSLRLPGCATFWYTTT